jgi:DNA polymerase-3 subunit delta'
VEHPDLLVVQADNVGGVLKVDAVRQLQRSLSLSPYEARYRVALFLRFEEAHLSAANALLKTLEEPADRVVLILTAETADELFPTIVSRCEVFRLRPLPLEQLADGLQSTLNLDENQAALLAHISNGCPGTAIRLASDKEMIKFRQECIQDFQQLMVSDLVARFTVADSLSKEKERLRAVLSTWLSVCRDILLHAAGASLPLQNPDMRDWVGQMANEVGLQQAQKSVIAIQRTQMLLNRNANARLALEVLMLSLPGL